jgi:hypothetical protein
MHTIRKLFFPAWIFITGILTGCGGPVDPDVDLLEIDGASWACNVNTSYAKFGSASEQEDSLKLILPASEGDLLYMFKNDLQYYYRYHSKDGPALSLSFDTLDAVSVYLNGSLDYMEITDSTSLDAFRTLTVPELEQLSSLLIGAPLSDDLLSVLRSKQESLQGTSLILESVSGTGQLSDLLSIFRPPFLVLNNSSALPEPHESFSFSGMELLWMDGNILSLNKLADCCGDLEALIVADWKPKPGELLPLAGLKKLRSLTIAESGLTTLSSVKFPASLHNLYLVSCDTLSDISSLTGLQKLKRLNLTLCSRLADLTTLEELEPLQCFSFPPKVSQQQFKELTEHFPQLELIELIDCEQIENLYPLEGLPQLHTLLLQLEKAQLQGLDSLKQLHTLILADKLYEDNEQWISELKTSLPNTTIVPGSGLCLGSGWLLLLIPFVLIFRNLSRRKS